MKKFYPTESPSHLFNRLFFSSLRRAQGQSFESKNQALKAGSSLSEEEGKSRFQPFLENHFSRIFINFFCVETVKSFAISFTTSHSFLPDFAGEVGTEFDPYQIQNQHQPKSIGSFCYFHFILNNDLEEISLRCSEIQSSTANHIFFYRRISKCLRL
ncbi:hypothetical protein P872_20025 [Rhodonellum psychrophilum GCM71 = DSM 17998]|uniref:Uncharacterized protein n=2 Tax=Rhodonellum TaxID=336827 RepID=U5BY57_9BACT|nr:hypothetical protein P872_20025 [Rhodonellum psychrophilum GCM71 = DSM 17998]SDZ37188.1 hypothetical protein SAMN05444412_111165 [Rhodonellum ikkaensis]